MGVTPHYQFTAIGDSTRIRVLRIYERNNQKTAIQVLDYVLEKLPFRVECIQTDNGAEFQGGFHWHLLDRGIGHVYIKPATPRLTGRSRVASSAHGAGTRRRGPIASDFVRVGTGRGPDPPCRSAHRRVAAVSRGWQGLGPSCLRRVRGRDSRRARTQKPVDDP